MVPLTSLLVPILLGAVLVFVVSAIFHMMLPFHRADWKALPGEAEVGDVMRRFNIPPGDYMMPHHTGGPEAMKDPAFVEKMTKGPIAVMTVFPSGPPTMGPQLAMWFVYCAVVSLFAGYVASRALGPGARYLDVSQIASTVAFVGFNLALWQNSIWYRRAWRTTFLYTVEGIIYGLLVGGAFGWLWPKA
jgi:hypothetical protein